MTRKNNIKSYHDLIKIDSFLDRIQYLMLFGIVNEETFGVNRYLNQNLYQSEKWRQVRRKVVLRDNGYDLGHFDYPICGNIYVHHIQPITIDDILSENPLIYDPNNLISCSREVHNVIHYSTLKEVKIRFAEFVERTKYDTCPWRYN